MEQIIISKSIDNSIKQYLLYKDTPEVSEFNDFFIIVIRLLCVIYGESEIIGPYYKMKSADFDNNLIKYGYELDKVIDFKQQVEKAYNLQNAQKTNPYFISIQKILIDMLMAKKDQIDVEKDDIDVFYELLYTSHNKNPIQVSYSFLNSNNSKEIDDYFKESLSMHKKINSKKNKVILNPYVYSIFGISLDQISEMSAEHLDGINKKIYAYFKISETAINKEYLLEQAVEKYQMQHERITTGNGYVDILLVLAFLVTAVMIITIGVSLFK